MESNPDIDKDVEHIPVKSPSRRKIWLPFLVIATLIVAAAVIITAVLLASKDNDSKNFTKNGAICHRIFRNNRNEDDASSATN